MRVSISRVNEVDARVGAVGGDGQLLLVGGAAGQGLPQGGQLSLHLHHPVLERLLWILEKIRLRLIHSASLIIQITGRHALTHLNFLCQVFVELCERLLSDHNLCALHGGLT